MADYQSPGVVTVPVLASGGAVLWIGALSIVRTICTLVVIPFPA